jgi:NAD(P)-dependent dehydrogenase (short-subunit alcohol dehydrogenase family)
MPDRDNLFDLSGKVAVVTGGSRGLGREMAGAFARHGATVVVASRKLDPCLELASELTESFGTEAIGVACHVGHWDDCDALIATTIERFGTIDVLVNNAGMSPLYPSLVEISEELYDKVVDVNLKGPFRLSALVGTRMAEGDGGSIIMVSSTASLNPSPNEAQYGAAKAGVNSLTRTFAMAFGPKVRCNCIVPGPFLTDISKAWDLEAMERDTFPRLGMKRGGRPDEVVGAALYFASDASSYTTGAILRVDGGVP